MIKVALEDALMKLKDHFHGEKHSQQGCFSSKNTNKANKEKSIYKKKLSLLHLYKKMTTVFIVGPQHACRVVNILMAHRDCSKACQDDKELYHNADCHFCLCCH